MGLQNKYNTVLETLQYYLKPNRLLLLCNFAVDIIKFRAI